MVTKNMQLPGRNILFVTVIGLLLVQLNFSVVDSPKEGPILPSSGSSNGNNLFDLALFLNQTAIPEHDEKVNTSSPCQEIETGNLTLLPKSNQTVPKWPRKIRAGDKAICNFKKTQVSFHFPHAMQQIYSCWSLWEANRELRPYIVGPPGHRGFANRSRPAFIEGMLNAMEGAFNITVVTTDELSPSELRHAVNPTPPTKPYHILRDDAWKWTNGILKHQKIARDYCTRSLRIGILNRNGTRAILNANHILSQALLLFGEVAQIDHMTFENKPFREQLAWFASHDIVLTGHGAQEVSIPFMPKCGVLLELFPVGYYVPRFFGSLSDSNHLRHYTIYEKYSSDPIGETKNMSKSLRQRNEARQQKFCPSTRTILSFLLTAARDVVSCCNNLGHEDSNTS